MRLLIALAALLAGRALDAQSTPAPDATRFTRTVLADGLDEPIQMEFDRAGRLYWIERGGEVKRLDERTGKVTALGTISTAKVGEAGLVGILLDRDFERTRQFYVSYSVPAPSGDSARSREMRLSRFTLTNPTGRDTSERIDVASEVVLLRWPYERAAHVGGGMAWDSTGNLYLTIGENTQPTQYSPVVWTNEGGREQDSQRTSANSNDLRGKIIRIRPRPDGTYAIPEGNLFPPGTPNTRPEIYAMGLRNPWRVSIDSRTGWLYWGEVGPDAGKDSAGVGPMGYDEFNVAKRAGYYGWPYVIGYQRPYNQYDNAAGRYGPPHDPERLVNASPNNTGIRELPPARAAMLAYPYGVSEEFPVLGSGGRCAVGGPLYRRGDRPGAARPFPAYFEGKWLVTDCVRAWIMVVTPNDSATRAAAVERLLPDEKYNTPLDLDFGPNGDLYVVEWGSRPDGRISKIAYNAGNRAPRVVASASRTAGAAPLRVTLSSRGTVDHDTGDRLRYAWVVRPEGSAAAAAAQTFATANPTVTLTRPGRYLAELTVTDPSGATGRARVALSAGNEPPRVQIAVTRGNRSFYFPDSTIDYRVTVTDREDGQGAINTQAVSVVLDYVPAGTTPAEVRAARDSVAPTTSLRHTRALAIMARSDCRVCHTADRRLVGPSFVEVAERRRAEPDAVERIAQKIIGGSSGEYGPAHMPPHPGFTPAEAARVAEYVLSFADTGAAPRRVPRQGTVTTAARLLPRPDWQVGRRVLYEQGSYVLRARYTDRGANGAPPIAATDALLLRYPVLPPETAEVISSGIVFNESKGDPGFVINRDGAHIGFRAIDLTGIARIEVGALTRFYTWSHFKGATVEVRLDSAAGPLLGSPVAVTPPEGAGQVVLGENLERPVSVDVGGVRGVHDVYVVFRNPRAGPADALLLITGIEFKPNGGGGSGGGGDAGVPAGFTRIFNGTDLTGWHPSRTTHHGTTPDVRVEDGAIVLRQRPYGQGGVLLSDRKYRNFELYVEAKPDWGTNGGIFFRSSESGSAYQLEMVGGGAAGTGHLFGEMLRVTTRARAEGAQRAWRPDDWNAIRLRVTGAAPRVTLWINGALMYDVQAARNDLIADATEGYIGFQSHWSAYYGPTAGSFDMSGSWKPGAAHRYRNVAIRELP
jgi:cytochrome c